jgi:hypothetical protein
MCVDAYTRRGFGRITATKAKLSFDYLINSDGSVQDHIELMHA